MTVAQALLGFVSVAVLLTITPGLDTTLVLRFSLVRGARHAVASALGVCAGALAWGAAAAVGAAALLAASDIAYRVVTVAGAAYMIWLGGSMIVSSFRRRGAPQTDSIPTPVTAVPVWRAFVTGAWTNLLNPKVGVFYIATIPQFIPEGASHLLMGLGLAGVHCLLSMAWFTIIITGAQFAKRWLAHARALRIIDRVAGGILIAFGARFALEAR